MNKIMYPLVDINKNQKARSAFEFDSLKETIIKYYLEKYFEIDVQMKL
jgi:hypothetical protein